MSSIVAAGRRALPLGYLDFARQLAIWFGFYVLYQLARGAADRDTAAAFDNGLRLIDLEKRMGALWELSLQGALGSSHLLIELTSWTYWLSQFVVVAIALLYVYFRAHDRFFRFRDTLIAANLIGLIGYVLVPTAPPRMFPEAGFQDTLLEHSTVNHSSAAVAISSNPYAAMPSLHSADALIVGITMALVVRRPWAKALWLAWPAWVWFSVMATGNHFWLDIAAGVLVAGVAALLVARWRRRTA